MVFTYDISRPAGEVAAAALVYSKQEVASMQLLLRQGEHSRLTAALAPVCGKDAQLSPADLRDAVDELVCFRVYMRVYLGKYRLPGVYPQQAAEDFCRRLPELESALHKPGQEHLTVLPAALTPSLTVAKNGNTLISFSSLCQLLLFDMLRARETGGGVLMCPLCRECFVSRRSDVVYCPACRPGGARTAHTNAVRSDPLLTAFARARQRVYTAKSRGRLEPEAAAQIIARMEEALANARLNDSDTDALEGELCQIYAKKVTKCY